jgi:hypothetical protein
MRLRTDNPWYPNARLFRQEQAGDWVRVVRQVVDALDEFSSRALDAGPNP